MINVAEEFVVKGKVLKEKFNLDSNLRFYSQDIIDEKVYISTESLIDETWYRISILENEIQVSEIVVISSLSDFDFHI